MIRELVLEAARVAAIAMGDAPTVRNVASYFKRISGRGIRTEEVRAYLARYREPKPPNQPDTRIPLVRTESGNKPDTTGNPSPVRELRNSSSLSSVSQPIASAAQKPAKQQKLGFDAPVEQRTRAIVDLLWVRIQPMVGRSMSKTSWRTRNVSVARDWARSGLSDGEIIAAHQASCDRLGGRCWSLRVVADQLLREDGGGGGGSRAAPAEDEPEYVDVLDLFPDDDPIWEKAAADGR